MAISPAEGRLITFHCDCERCSDRGGATYLFFGPEAPKFSFETIVAKQKTHHVFTGMAPAREIDACSRVPSLDESEEYADLSQRLYDQDPLQWQRSLKRLRTEQMSTFWRSRAVVDQHIESNKVLNPIVLNYSKEHHLIPGTEEMDTHDDYPDSPGHWTLQLPITWYDSSCSRHPNEPNKDLIEILEDLDGNNNVCGKEYVLQIIEQLRESDEVDCDDWHLYADFCPDKTCENHSRGMVRNQKRPIEIIDGQHRCRGINSPENSVEEHKPNYGICKQHPQQTYDRCVQFCGEDCWIPTISPTNENIGFSMLATSTPNNNNELQIRERREAAKIFVDINTMAQDLAPTHKITMLWRHRFRRGRISQWKNSDELDFSQDNTEESLVYRLILDMARVGEFNPQTKGRIPPLINTGNGKELVSVEKLRIYIKNWRQTGKVMSGYTRHTLSVDYARLFNDYLRGWAWHFSGPIGDLREHQNRVWTPSHSEFETGNPVWDEVNQQEGLMLAKLETGGHWQDAQSTQPERAAMGEVTQTGMMKVVFELFDIITYHILNQQWEIERQPDDAEKLPVAYLANTYNPITINGARRRVTEEHYRTVIGEFRDKMNFTSNEIFSKETLLGKEAIGAKMIARRMGWL